MKIVECPRDAMQGIEDFIPTNLKAKYINALLKVGFDTIDFGSFVSPKAIPQMKDTAEVLRLLDLSNTKSNLLAIVANLRGVESTVQFEEINHIGYPLSLSETFQQRNTNRSIENAFADLSEIQNVLQTTRQGLVVYLSMGFGNPYGDPYEVDLVGSFVEKLEAIGVKTISLSDTIGVAKEKLIFDLLSSLIPKFPHIEFGAHLHSRSEESYSKIESVYDAGCRRIDGALRGFGGCPMAKDDLTGNMTTEIILEVLSNRNVNTKINQSNLDESLIISREVFH
ncbi:MAG: hydroxymethylglutaryl-CoA lyase [Cyclobacteriaceae bacterium]